MGSLSTVMVTHTYLYITYIVHTQHSSSRTISIAHRALHLALVSRFLSFSISPLVVYSSLKHLSISDQSVFITLNDLDFLICLPFHARRIVSLIVVVVAARRCPVFIGEGSANRSRIAREAACSFPPPLLGGMMPNFFPPLEAKSRLIDPPARSADTGAHYANVARAVQTANHRESLMRAFSASVTHIPEPK